MKLQQLKYILEVYKKNLNVSEAAQSLYTSQPAISKQILLLEEELGVSIFVRQGKRMVGVTKPGQLILEMAQRLMGGVENIKKIGEDLSIQNSGSIRLAGVYAFIHYELPDKIGAFKEACPAVKLSILSGTSAEVARLVRDYEADIGVVHQQTSCNPELYYLPCTSWSYQLLMPTSHVLASKSVIELQDLVRYPLIISSDDSIGLDRSASLFEKAGIEFPTIDLVVADAEMVKAFVQKGLGVGLIESMAVGLENLDEELEVISVSHLLPEVETRLILRKDQYISRHLYELIQLLNPRLTREKIEQLSKEAELDYVI
ncbi:MAG: LysR substrate-binding domain-containing protein [Neisseriaceae bacterium]